ncbi:formate dehydrogenase accessory sulfurtransferase FdhD [Methanobacterium petrolearium]|uniref:formate dehydrogenase accessory sulfurtransferase FdhD n=1 Tax=Methanobacterium petrolearium TaxID=710190 RepID=UPI001AE811CD|nr:formate dehydrogenase accessory sulfurtransferase FdhD [Methanobacterium petrolearium]
MFKKIPSKRVKNSSKDVIEKIAIDSEIELVINEVFTRKFSISPECLQEFAIGYLLGEGLITATEDIDEIKVFDSKVEVKVNLEDFDLRKELVVGSDCFGGWRHKIDFVGEIESNFQLSKKDLLESFSGLKEKARVWKETGGTHIAGLVSHDGFISREDVSRHVAADKVIGAAALENVNFGECFMVYSGRMPADMMIKLARVGIPVIASNSAPTSSGYEVALKAGITLIGFLREKRFNVYTHPQRVSIQ